MQLGTLIKHYAPPKDVLRCPPCKHPFWVRSKTGLNGNKFYYLWCPKCGKTEKLGQSPEGEMR